MGREFELKYRANPEKISRIREKFGDFSQIFMETAYYDALDRSLSERRWTLRRRMENEASVCTLKVPLADGSRGEWEVEADSIEEALPKLCNLGAPEALLTLTKPGLVHSCGARFTRLAKVLTLPDCTAELALDQGVLLGGGQELSFSEVEVELKDGSEEAAAAFAEALAAEFALAPEPKSKVQRALELT